MPRRGFTLLELLVATGVFVVGFVSVFSLFLAGVRFRRLAEDTARVSVAASSIVSELRIDAGSEPGATPRNPQPPSAYLGDGFAPKAEKPTDALSDSLFPYKPQPGIWYQVIESTDLNGGDDPNTTALRLKLFVYPLAAPTDNLSYDDINKRLRLKLGTASAVRNELVLRGLAWEYKTVIVRRPSWLPVN